MDAKAAHQRVQSALKTELSKHWGQIAAIEAKVSRSEGYLRRFCRGQQSMPLHTLLESLEALDVEPGEFLSRALGARPNLDDSLRALERPGKEIAALAKIEKATRTIETGGSSERVARATDPTSLVEKIAGCSLKEQRRRLRTAQRYRCPDFVAAYLKHLDALIFENPRLAGKLAETVAIELIPALQTFKRELLELQCLALGNLGTAYRTQGDFPTASRALINALELARRHCLEPSLAQTLLRSSYLLADNGQHQEALAFLREAFEINFDIDAPIEMAKISITRGAMFLALGEYSRAVQVTRKGLELLPEQHADLQRWYLAGYQYLALAHERTGDLEGAEAWLDEALARCTTEGSVNRAKLIWQIGRIAAQREDYDLAENRLKAARQLLIKRTAPDAAMLSLDLARVLLARAKFLEAQELCLQMVSILGHLENKMARAALTEFVRLVLEGKLTSQLVDRFQEKIAQASA